MGAYDLSGNVWEWTNSLSESYPYDATDGRERDTGNSAGVRRVIRGGAWNSDGLDMRSAARGWNDPVLDYGDGLGFRCAHNYKP